MLKPKLLFVVNVDSFFISHRLPIGLHALKNGFEVHIACAITEMKSLLLSYGFHIHSLDLDRRSTGLFSNAITFFQITRLFYRLKPEIVHLVSIKPVLLGGIAARIVGIRSIVSAISGLGFVFISTGIWAHLRRLLVTTLYKVALNHRRISIIFQNSDDQKLITGTCKIPIKKTILIKGSGVNLKRFTPTGVKANPPVVTLPSRMLIDKGILDFIEAARILKKSGSPARFVLVGQPDPGNPATIRDEQILRWQHEGLIEYWGHSDDMPRVFSHTSIVVLPSYREGLPKVLIEAAACGRAVVTTDVPGCRDAIERDVTGLLVPVRDSEALAGAIKRLLDNPSLCEEMGRAGRELTEREFGVEKVVDAHLRIYQELFDVCILR